MQSSLVTELWTHDMAMRPIWTSNELVWGCITLANPFLGLGHKSPDAKSMDHAEIDVLQD